MIEVWVDFRNQRKINKFEGRKMEQVQNT